MTAAMPTLGRLLISHITLRGPELKQLYLFVASSGTASYDDIAKQFVPAWQPGSNFGLDEAPLRESLNFLLVAGMLSQQGDSRRKASFRVASGSIDRSFELELLEAVARQPDDRQRAIALVHKHLVLKDVLSTTSTELRSELERSPYGKLFIWTTEKILFWSQLASYLGLIYRMERSLELVIAPQPNLLVEALRWSTALREGQHLLAECLQCIDASLFACFTHQRRVHSGLARSLVALHRLGHVRLTHNADSAQSLMLQEWRVSHIEVLRPTEVRA